MGDNLVETLVVGKVGETVGKKDNSLVALLAEKKESNWVCCLLFCSVEKLGNQQVARWVHRKENNSVF
jgi:hypothetical protein